MPRTPDGKPGQCMVREVQNRLKTQGLTANNLNDVVSNVAAKPRGVPTYPACGPYLATKWLESWRT